MLRRRRRRGVNPKYWWVWAIVIVAIIFFAQNYLAKLVAENAAKREAQKIESEASVQNDSDSPIYIPEDGQQ